MSSVTIPYGDSAMRISLPARADFRLAGGIPPDPLPDVARSVEEALARPEGSAPLSRLIPRSGKIAVLISDLTRGGTAASVLLPVLSHLERHEAGPDRVSVFIAGGMHRGQTESEMESLLGGQVAGRYRIVQHDARDASSLMEAGTTSRGTKCLFNREVMESSLVVGVGSATFHYFAGFGGGRKLVLPGISGERTILSNHRLSLREDPGSGLSPGCEPGRLDGNPVHADMLEGAMLLPVPVFMVCAVAGADDLPAFVCAGAMDDAHRKASSVLMENCALSIERRARTVIASCGGSPKDINLLQAHKTIRHASFAVEDGGLLLVAAECREGIGSESLEDSFSKGRGEVPGTVRKGYTLNSQAAMSIYEITGRIEVKVHSSLPEEELSRFGFGAWGPEETAAMLEEHGASDVLVLPNAASFLPVIR